jgi:hypothetical protein
MNFHEEVLLSAADHLASSRGLSYRERLNLERAVYRLTNAHVASAFGWNLNSMSVTAYEQFVADCRLANVQPDDPKVTIVDLGFAVMRLIASIANADPYVLNENIFRIIHRYSTGVATLPSALLDLAAAHSSHGRS